MVMGHDGRDPVIELDKRGTQLLKSLAHPCTKFRVAKQPDGSIVLYPMSARDADLWLSGLVDQIVQNFSHPEGMIRLKPDKRLLDFAPAAWQAYQSLRADHGGSPPKHALDQLADDPGLVRADPRSCRYLTIERQLKQKPEVWGCPLDVPNGTRWLVIWRETPAVIEIGYVGPGPGTQQAADRQHA
jgi:hypothetical protein